MRPTPRTLLVVDDEPTFIDDVLVPAIGPEWALRAAYNVPQAMEALETDEPLAAALVDWQLPGGSGLDVVAAIREKHPMMPVALISAHLRRQLPNQAFALGADYLIKDDCLPSVRLFLERASRQVGGALVADMEYLEKLSLTGRETAVVQLYARHLIEPEIAERLEISLQTVKHHIRGALEKSGHDRLRDLVCRIYWAPMSRRGP